MLIDQHIDAAVLRVYCYHRSKSPNWKFKTAQISKDLGMAKKNVLNAHKRMEIRMDENKHIKKTAAYNVGGYVDIPEDILLDKDLSPLAFKTWVYIASRPAMWDFSYNRLAKTLGVSGKTALKAIHLLEYKGLLRRSRGKNKRVNYIALDTEGGEMNTQSVSK